MGMVFFPVIDLKMAKSGILMLLSGNRKLSFFDMGIINDEAVAVKLDKKNRFMFRLNRDSPQFLHIGGRVDKPKLFGFFTTDSISDVMSEEGNSLSFFVKTIESLKNKEYNPRTFFSSAINPILQTTLIFVAAIMPWVIAGAVIASQDFSAYEGLISSPGDLLLDYFETPTEEVVGSGAGGK